MLINSLSKARHLSTKCPIMQTVLADSVLAPCLPICRQGLCETTHRSDCDLKAMCVLVLSSSTGDDVRNLAQTSALHH